MAPVKTITVELNSPQQKKSVVRFDSSEDNAALRTVYLDNASYAKLGSPDSIKIVISKGA